jgi:hypothetical protein
MPAQQWTWMCVGGGGERERGIYKREKNWWESARTRERESGREKTCKRAREQERERAGTLAWSKET